MYRSATICDISTYSVAIFHCKSLLLVEQPVHTIAFLEISNQLVKFSIQKLKRSYIGVQLS
jgi:hypothetical protein